MNEFVYEQKYNLTFFGKDVLRKKLVIALGDKKKILLIASQRLKPLLEDLKVILSEKDLIHFEEVVQHVPRHLVDKALVVFHENDIEMVLAIGGGSAIGLAKALALDTGCPIVVAPSTYSGSEMTDIWGISDENGKTTGRSPKVFPASTLYDPSLTQALPLSIAKTSAINSLAHLIEALYAVNSNPITRAVALHGTEVLMEGIKELAETQELLPVTNEKLLLGAYLSGKCLGEVSMALHHKTAHILGGSYSLEHSKVHTVLLPFAFAYQWKGLNENLKKGLEAIFNHSYPPLALLEIKKQLDTFQSLREIGYKKEWIGETVNKILAKPYPNPVKLERDRLASMLEMAYEGKMERME